MLSSGRAKGFFKILQILRNLKDDSKDTTSGHTTQGGSRNQHFLNNNQIIRSSAYDVGVDLLQSWKELKAPFTMERANRCTTTDLVARGPSLLFLVYCAATQQKQRSRETKRRKVTKKTDSASHVLNGKSWGLTLLPRLDAFNIKHLTSKSSWT